jgi:hypothetical protein
MSGTRIATRPGRLARTVILAVVVLVLGASGTWYATHPRALPTTPATVNAATVTGRPVYIGVFVPDRDFDRTLHLSGVKIHTTANTQVRVEPLLCRGGSIAVTSDPDPFCQELVNPEGEEFGTGDAIVLEVSAAENAIAVVDPVRLGFREGLQWGTERAGAGAIVTVRGR